MRLTAMRLTAMRLTAMRQPPGKRMFWLLALFIAAAVGGCRRAIVIVPHTDRSYTERDTLYGYHRGNRVVIAFRFDSVLRVDTVTRVDTAWREGSRTIVRVDTLRRVDTVKVSANSSTTVPGGSTTLPGGPTTLPGGPTLDRPGTPGPTTGRPGRVDTVVVTRVDTISVSRPDTVVVARVDTVVVARVDTVVVSKRDTVVLAGRRMLFVPPGQYPPEGQCRVWVHDLPPGRQADAAPCNSLGTVPAGAFILFGGDAWDADYDWVAESRRAAVPPEIIAVSRRRRP